MIRTDKVSYRVSGKSLVSGVSLHIAAGVFVALTGPNGAGKSTLLKMLSGDISPSEGHVSLDGKPVMAYSKRALALKRSVMPQDVLLEFSFKAEEVVMMGRYPYMDQSRGEDDDREVTVDSMRKTETTHLAERLYPTLSGGEQARVSLARVLAQKTPVVLLDEPTASLDPRHQHLVMNIARNLARQGGTVVAILHDLNLAALYADRVAIMSQGCVKAFGPPDEVLNTTLLQDVFRTRFQVTKHPLIARPLVLSLPL